MGIGFFSIGGCGGVLRGLVGACTKTIDPPDPKLATCRVIPEGIGKGIAYCADNSGDWDVDNPATYKALNIGLTKIVSCMEKKLDANIDVIVEPGIIPPLVFEKEAAENSTLSRGAEFYKESETEVYPDEFPLEEYCQTEPDDPACVPAEQKETILRSQSITVTIPAEFLVVLIDKDACVVKQGVWGVTLFDNGVPRIWINRTGQLWEHELSHLLASLMGLTDTQEEKLESCTPEIDHQDL